MQRICIILFITYLVHLQQNLVHNYPTMLNNKSTNDSSEIEFELATFEIDNGEIVTVSKLADLCITENVDAVHVENAFSDNEHNDSMLLGKSVEIKSADDLIFAVKEDVKIATTTTTAAYQQIDLLTSDEQDDLSISIEQEHRQQHTSINVVTPLNLSDFIALIPAKQVQAIVGNYYRHDPEVQRAYNFLASPQYLQLKQQTLILREIQDFLRYLNNSGLDLMNLLSELSHITMPIYDVQTTTVSNGN